MPLDLLSFLLFKPFLCRFCPVLWVLMLPPPCLMVRIMWPGYSAVFGLLGAFLRSGQRPDVWRADDIVDVCTSSAVSASELCEPIAGLFLPFLPVCTIWQDGLILVMSGLCHIFPLCYNGLHSAPRKVQSFANLFYITFTIFFLPNNFTSKLHGQILGLHEAGLIWSAILAVRHFKIRDIVQALLLLVVVVKCNIM